MAASLAAVYAVFGIQGFGDGEETEPDMFAYAMLTEEQFIAM